MRYFYCPEVILCNTLYHMGKSLKLLKYLNTLDHITIAEFATHLRKTNGRKKNLIKIFEQVQIHLEKSNKSVVMDTVSAQRAVFGADSITDGARPVLFLNGLSDLNKMLKSFLIGRKAEQDHFESLHLWSMILGEHDISKDLYKAQQQLIQLTGENAERSIRHQFKMILANYVSYYHPANGVQPHISLIKNSILSLDAFYISLKLKLYCEMVNANKAKGLPAFNENLPKLDLSGMIAGVNLAKHPLIEVYYWMLQMLTDDEIHYFDYAVERLKTYAYIFDRDELQTVYSYINNSYSRSKHRKDKEFVRKMHEVNKFGLEVGLFKEKGQISTTIFNNIVNTACNCDDFDWAIHFVKEQGQYLTVKDQSATIAISEATILFGKKDFDGTIHKMIQLKRLEINQKIRVKILTLMCQYEMAISKKSIKRRCTGLTSFLSENASKSKRLVDASIKFAELLKMISSEKCNKEELLAAFNRTKEIAYKEWILEKIMEYDPTRTRKSGG